MYKDFIKNNENLSIIDLQENIVDNELMSLLKDTGVAVLAACPSAGKTAMSIAFINEYIIPMNLKVLVLAHNQTILRNQYFDKLNDYNVNFSYELIEKGKDFANAKSDVVVALPSTIYRLKKGFSRYDVILIDEAHEYYGKPMVNSIIEKMKPKYQILLTGTPSSFIAKNMKVASISVNELLKRNLVSDLVLDISTSTYTFEQKNYNDDDELRNNVKFSDAKTSSTLDKLLLDLIKRLSNQNNLSSFVFNWKSLTNELDKTMIACKNVKLANKVYKYMIDRDVNCVVSHSENDANSENFIKFQEDDDIKVLIVVNRGGLGYNNENLVNFIDMTFSKNINTTFQRYARVLRRHSEGKTKLYMKVVPEKMSDFFESIMDCVLCLTQKKYYEIFNGKNFNGFLIPEREKYNQVKENENENEKSKKQQEKVYAPISIGQPLSLLNRVFDEDRDLQKYAWTTLREVSKKLGMLKRLPTGFWNEENCRLEASKYSTQRELHKHNRSCHQACVKYGLITEIYGEVIKTKKPANFWSDKENCRIEASKYSNRTKLGKASAGCYDSCRINNWLDEFYPNSKYSKKPVGFWDDKENCRLEASKYPNRTKLAKSVSACYIACQKNNWLDEFYPNPHH